VFIVRTFAGGLDVASMQVEVKENCKMTQMFIVGTGIRTFRIEALSPQIAISSLKYAIHMRRFQHTNPEIGLSLVEALDEERLDFVVMDDQRTRIISGELEGVYQEPASAFLAGKLRHIIPFATRQASLVTF
jgi:hypothetical protein